MDISTVEAAPSVNTEGHVTIDMTKDEKKPTREADTSVDLEGNPSLAMMFRLPLCELQAASSAGDL